MAPGKKGPLKVRFDWSPGTVVPLTLLALFLCAYIAMILVGEDFAWYDDSVLTAFSLRGINFPVPVWPQGGRFFPLGEQEYNLIGHFTRTVAGYYALTIVEVLTLAAVLLILDDQLSIAARAVITSLALITPSAVVIFMGLTYPERNLLFLLVCLALFVKLFERTRSAPWAVGAVVCSQLMLYLKEPVFLLLLSFAGARLILRSWNPNGGWNFRRLWDRESRLDLCLAAVSLAFLGFYAIMMFPHTSAEYLVSVRVSQVQAVRYYAKVDALAWVFTAVFAARMYRIFRGRGAPQLLWDGLACGGVAYFCAYLGIRMASSYYLAPVDLIAVLYLGHFLCSSWGEMRLGVRAAAAALAVIIVYQNVELSAFRVLERKFFIRQKAVIARLVLDRYQRHPELVRKLYFPFTEPYMLAEFAAYMSYLGLPVEEDGDGFRGGAHVAIVGAKIAGDGRCIPERSFVCHTGASDAGSLVVVLPDDPVLPAETELRRESEEKLRSYDPRVQPPHLLIRALGFMWSRNLS